MNTTFGCERTSKASRLTIETIDRSNAFYVIATLCGAFRPFQSAETRDITIRVGPALYGVHEPIVQLVDRLRELGDCATQQMIKVSDADEVNGDPTFIILPSLSQSFNNALAVIYNDLVRMGAFTCLGRRGTQVRFSDAFTHPEIMSLALSIVAPGVVAVDQRGRPRRQGVKALANDAFSNVAQSITPAAVRTVICPDDLHLRDRRSLAVRTKFDSTHSDRELVARCFIHTLTYYYTNSRSSFSIPSEALAKVPLCMSDVAAFFGGQHPEAATYHWGVSADF